MLNARADHGRYEHEAVLVVLVVRAVRDARVHAAAPCRSAPARRASGPLAQVCGLAVATPRFKPRNTAMLWLAPRRQGFLPARMAYTSGGATPKRRATSACDMPCSSSHWMACAALRRGAARFMWVVVDATIRVLTGGGL